MNKEYKLSGVLNYYSDKLMEIFTLCFMENVLYGLLWKYYNHKYTDAESFDLSFLMTRWRIKSNKTLVLAEKKVIMQYIQAESPLRITTKLVDNNLNHNYSLTGR